MKTILLLVGSALVGSRQIHSSSSGDKIVGGSLATDIREVPYMTGIYLKDPAASPKEPTTWHSYTAGTILSHLYVITACQNLAELDEDGELVSMTYAYPLKNWQFVAGTTEPPKGEWAQFRTPASLLFHPKCQLDPYLTYDVAVAKMSEPFTVNDYVKPVKFFGFDGTSFTAHVDEIISSQNIKSRHQPPTCVMSGWGSTEEISIVDHFGINSGVRPASVAPGVDFPPDILEVFDERASADDPTSETPGTEDTGKDQPPPSAYVEVEQLRSLGVYPMHDRQCLTKMTESIKEGLGNTSDAKDKNEVLVRDYSKILRNQICTLSRFGNESSCHGDPGSGLVCNGYLIGVISWSIGCATSAPEVVQSLPVVLEWIKDEVCTLRHYNDAEYLHPKCNAPSETHQGSRQKHPEPWQIPGPEEEQSSSAVRKIIPLWPAMILTNFVSILEFQKT